MDRRLAIGGLLLLFLTGCDQSLVHRRDTMVSATASQPNGRLDMVTTDAAQRIIAVRSMPVSTAKTSGNSTSASGGASDANVDPWVMCAEPSPDTMTSATTSIAAALKNSRVSAEVAATIASQAAMIGLRTQSITLLRDEAYRLCEGYLNHAIDGWMFTILHRRFQNLMIANLAIEQLTGYARPTIVTIGNAGTATAANNLLDTQAAYDQAVKDAGSAKDDLAKAQKAADDNDAVIKKNDTSSDDAKAALADASQKKPGLDSTLSSAKQKKDDADENVDSLRKLLDGARAPSVTGSTANPTVVAPAASAAATEIVARTVENIVAASIDKDLAGDFCLNYFVTYPGGRGGSDPVFDSCNLRLQKQKIDMQKLLKNGAN